MRLEYFVKDGVITGWAYSEQGAKTTTAGVETRVADLSVDDFEKIKNKTHEPVLRNGVIAMVELPATATKRRKDELKAKLYSGEDLSNQEIQEALRIIL